MSERKILPCGRTRREIQNYRGLLDELGKMLREYRGPMDQLSKALRDHRSTPAST